ncbi:MAG: hypothetical protein AABY22_16730 [Nanoarchaeota archaeon]
MSKPRPFSKLKKQIDNLFVPELNMSMHCLSYPIRSQRGSSSIARFYVKLGKEIIWDFPKDSPIKNIDYHQWDSIINISELIREYIDTPVSDLLSNKFELDHIDFNDEYTFDIGLVDIFRAGDRRLGKKSLDVIPKNETVNKIIKMRQQIA